MATISQAAAHLCMSTKGVSQLLARGIVNRAPRGEYDLAVVREQYLSHMRDIAGARSTPATLALQVERGRLVKAQADAWAMANERSRSDLVCKEDVADHVDAQVRRIRSRILSIPSAVAPSVHAAESPKAVQRLLDAAITSALKELHVSTDAA